MRRIIQVLTGHPKGVSSVSWSRNGRRLLASDYGGYLILWDVFIGKPLIKLKFNCQLEYSWLHQRLTYVIEICDSVCPLELDINIIN